MSFGSEVLVPSVSSVGHYEATIRINDPNEGYLIPGIERVSCHICQ